MALLGTGVLAIWNGISASAEDDFVSWHVREHIPERVGLPGFLRGRRYVAIDGKPKYFDFYEASDLGVLSSDTYRVHMNAPTEWTKRVVAHFTDTLRTVCDLAASFGRGEGAWVETIRLSASADAGTFKTAIAEKILRPVSEQPGIVGAHLLQGQQTASAGDTAEKKLRAQPDQVADWVVLIEGIEQDALTAIRRDAASNDAFLRQGAKPSIERGLYRLQFALTKPELDVSG
jgi:hypothetical protein